MACTPFEPFGPIVIGSGPAGVHAAADYLEARESLSEAMNATSTTGSS